MNWSITLRTNTIDAIIGEYTHSVAPMYVEAMGKAMSGFSGGLAIHAIEILSDGFVKMLEDPEVYKDLEPKNGTGDYEGAIQYLEKLLLACMDHPFATIVVE